MSKKKVTPPKSPLVFHPVLMAIFPALILWSNNITDMPPQHAVRPLLVGLLVFVLLWLLLGWLIKNYEKAGLFTSVLIIALFFFGYIPKSTLSLGAAVGVWSAVWGVALIAIWRTSRPLHWLTTYLNLFTLVLLISPISKIGPMFYEWSLHKDSLPYTAMTLQAADDAPDIYYIVLDAYGRADVLNETYGVDTTEFLHQLEARGFYVADQSRSNYIRTKLSLASSLSMNYIHGLGDSFGPESTNIMPLVELIHHSQIRESLAAVGYEFVTIGTHFTITDIRDADVYYSSTAIALNPFEEKIAQLSLYYPVRYLISPLFSPYTEHREHIHYIFDSLPELAERPGHQFAFIHIISPHPPFIFTADGQPREPDRDFSYMDGSDFLGDRDEYITGYAQQVEYLNKLVLQGIDDILANSTTPPIIILQGDHGPGAYLEWNSLEQSCPKERTSILNAYYLPNADNSQLYENITPVNSFRVVLNQYFQANLPLLPDKTYFSGYYPFEVIDVTDNSMPACTAP